MFHRDFSTGGGICTQSPHCLGRSLAPEVSVGNRWKLQIRVNPKSLQLLIASEDRISASKTGRFVTTQ